jgi:hypothetical protein
VAQLLNTAIKRAGLQGQGFSAKCFRPTGATVAIDCKHDADMVMKVGKWRSREIFMEHYVHSQTPVSLSSDILGIK